MALGVAGGREMRANISQERSDWREAAQSHS